MSERNESARIGHDELMRYIDGELPPERARAVEAALETSTELRRDHVIFSRMKSDLEELGESMETRGTVWAGVSRKLTRPVGWFLFVAGLVLWAAYGTYAYLAGADALWEKLITSAIVVGVVILLASVMVERYRDHQTDPYREIER